MHGLGHPVIHRNATNRLTEVTPKSRADRQSRVGLGHGNAHGGRRGDVGRAGVEGGEQQGTAHADGRVERPTRAPSRPAISGMTTRSRSGTPQWARRSATRPAAPGPFQEEQGQHALEQVEDSLSSG